ncbi:hypothetical protein B0H13DRAFT_2326216 [Mycena leptocephala]|nr:hypothetical protein B0H13DRAFT_2326216 [Mycena leptocephala]
MSPSLKETLDGELKPKVSPVKGSISRNSNGRKAKFSGSRHVAHIALKKFINVGKLGGHLLLEVLALAGFIAGFVLGFVTLATWRVFNIVLDSLLG